MNRHQARTLVWFALASLVSLLVLVALYQAFSFTHYGPSAFDPYLVSVREPPPTPVPFHSCQTCTPLANDGFFCQECEFDKPAAVVKPPSDRFVASHRHMFLEQYLSNHSLLFDCRSYDSWCHEWMDAVLQDSPDLLSMSPLSAWILSLFLLLLLVYSLSAFFVIRLLWIEHARIKLAERLDRESERDTLNRQLATTAIQAVAGSGLHIGDEGLRQRLVVSSSSSF